MNGNLVREGDHMKRVKEETVVEEESDDREPTDVSLFMGIAIQHHVCLKMYQLGLVVGICQSH